MKKLLNTKFIIVLLIGINLTGCTNEFDYGKLQNAVKTVDFSTITQTTVDVSGNVLTDNGASLTTRGICYDTSYNPSISNQKLASKIATLGNYTCSLVNLLPSTTYYARAYATNSFGTAYGASLSFTTLAATVPIISSTTAANSVTAATAITGGTISNSGASNVTSRGVCYSSSVSTPTIADTKTNDGTGIGTFISPLTGLKPNTIYYIRAYATNSIGTAYGDIKSFSTTTATIPIGLTTAASAFITQTTAIGGGNITNDGGATITSRGVCWSNTTGAPTIANSKTIDGTGIGTFTSSISSLSPGTTYYVRAYATNSIGTAYGTTIYFTTVAATIPTGVTTNTLSSITQNTANGGGNISTDGGATITSRGVCWSNTTSSPTITNSRTIDGLGVGTFTSSISNLTPSTTYYIRAYATNSVGTTYGNLTYFTTSAATIPVGITTSSLSSITQTTAYGGGSITADGGATITSRGVCWSSTNSTPTIFSSSTNNGTGTGTFASSVSGLIANTNYYVRAYATNSVGTAYGNVLYIKTLSNLSVGQSYQGGIIAYIFAPGDAGYISGQTHGLITTSSNQSSGAQWGCSSTAISGTNTSIGSGLTNTNAIVNGCLTNGIAARICSDLVTVGYSDWYLPSYYELLKLYTNRAIIGGFSSTTYWSSYQSSATLAYGINFATGITSNSTKVSYMYVRAIRTF